MTDASAKDPAALWREMVGQWEKSVNTLATDYMATNEFSREANRVMSASRHIGARQATCRLIYAAIG